MNEETVKGWLIKADADLKIGKDEMQTDDPVTDMVLFPYAAVLREVPEGVSDFQRQGVSEDTQIVGVD